MPVLARRLLALTLTALPALALFSLISHPASTVLAGLHNSSGSAPAFSQIIAVTTTNDELNSDGDCSLREALRAKRARRLGVFDSVDEQLLRKVKGRGDEIGGKGAVGHPIIHFDLLHQRVS